ncbi:MAG TPA: hypothetical protein VF618_19120 [Thermoanaerobaculia bacterium]
MSDAKKLTIYFRGVCAHFRGVVPGVPHRVVLPDASALRRGTIVIDGKPEDYVLLPHIAYVSPGPPEEPPRADISIPGLIEKGHVYGGVRLEIVNATGPLQYVDTPGTGDYDGIPQLTDVDPRYYPSAETVFGGRARCYLDVFHGRIYSASEGEATHARIDVTTKGTPLLQVTALTGDPGDVEPKIYTIPIETGHLTIGNTGPQCPGSGDFDFLLNFLTAHGGIPTSLPRQMIFLPPQAVDARAMAESVAVAAAGFTQFRADISRLPISKWDGGTPACSDTRYP